MYLGRKYRFLVGTSIIVACSITKLWLRFEGKAHESHHSKKQPEISDKRFWSF